MPKMKPSLILLMACASLASVVQAMVYDNRYLPLFQPARFRLGETSSIFSAFFDVATGSDAFGQDKKNTSAGIPELFGQLELNELSDALTKVGIATPLRPDWRSSTIAYDMVGKIQMQGVSFYFHQQLLDWLHIGASWGFLRTNAKQDFKLNTQRTNLTLSEADKAELERERVQMFSLIGVDSRHVSQKGFGDVDMWVRFGNTWDYTHKFRSVDLGLRLGFMTGTGAHHVPNLSASIAHGGDGHWGLYAMAEGLFELKEDMKVGMFLRISKRFEKTQTRRMPVCQEPDIFGATVGALKVDPGFTSIFSPYILLENLREGLAASVQYTLRAHGRDSVRDMRADKSVPVQLHQVRAHSGWASDYFSLYAMYDFGKVRLLRELAPILSFRWDVPAGLFISKRVVKTHHISLGLSFAF